MCIRDRPIDDVEVDWRKTKVWGAGGYYARLFVNVRGRETYGTVPAEDLPKLGAELEAKLRRVKMPNGEMLRAQVLSPAKLYRNVRGDPPDFMVYFQDLKWRSSAQVGGQSMFLAENDTGPDDAVHSFDGVYLLRAGSKSKAKHGPEQQIIDVGPTLLRRMGVSTPDGMQGRPIDAWL